MFKLFVISAILAQALASEYCFTDSDLRYEEYCYWDCCNEYTDDPCCDPPAGLYVGVTLGIIGFVVMISLLLVWYRRRRVTVVQYTNYPAPAQTTQVYTTAYPTQPQAGSPYAQPPPPYQQTVQPKPPY